MCACLARAGMPLRVCAQVVTVPLLPSVVVFVLSLVASVVLNVADLGKCTSDVRAYVIGCVVIGCAV